MEKPIRKPRVKKAIALPVVEVVKQPEDELPVELFNAAVKGSTCTYIGKKENGEVMMQVYGHACWGNCRYNDIYREKGYYDAYFDVASTQYSEEDVKRWVIFVTGAGFPCSFHGKKPLPESFGGRLGEFYHIKIDTKDYNSANHVWTGITAIRYVSYYISSSFKTIVRDALNFKIELKDKVDNLQALMLAHYPAFRDYFDYGHGLFGSVCKLINKEQMLKTVADAYNCNDTFYKNRLPVNKEVSTTIIATLLKEKNYDEVFKLLKKD